MTGSPGRPGRIKKRMRPHQAHLFFCVIRSGAESMPRHFPCFSGSQFVSVCFSLSLCLCLCPSPSPSLFVCPVFCRISCIFRACRVLISLICRCSSIFRTTRVARTTRVTRISRVTRVTRVYLCHLCRPHLPGVYRIITALTIRTPERRFSSSLSASRW